MKNVRKGGTRNNKRGQSDLLNMIHLVKTEQRLPASLWLHQRRGIPDLYMFATFQMSVENSSTTYHADACKAFKLCDPTGAHTIGSKMLCNILDFLK